MNCRHCHRPMIQQAADLHYCEFCRVDALLMPDGVRWSPLPPIRCDCGGDVREVDYRSYWCKRRGCLGVRRASGEVVWTRPEEVT